MSIYQKKQPILYTLLATLPLLACAQHTDQTKATAQSPESFVVKGDQNLPNQRNTIKTIQIETEDPRTNTDEKSGVIQVKVHDNDQEHQFKLSQTQLSDKAYVESQLDDLPPKTKAHISELISQLEAPHKQGKQITKMIALKQEKANKYEAIHKQHLAKKRAKLQQALEKKTAAIEKRAIHIEKKAAHQLERALKQQEQHLRMLEMEQEQSKHANNQHLTHDIAIELQHDLNQEDIAEIQELAIEIADLELAQLTENIEELHSLKSIDSIQLADLGGLERQVIILNHHDKEQPFEYVLKLIKLGTFTQTEKNQIKAALN
ncbi:hypothetical protein [Shewanella gelidii]|uniref:Uncharacterized protein n=1 Tax=Shewanella gelidii TaxID=1642821 RepID=A0A917NBM3_9GAMM|nr:hypothetical protein [Shewanella gelidii]MCL1098690.1 hypothetical protein [Shewanella gelidii]GGI86029.1 hypothetical protein GCM10009332_24200 [Shewanella gelidii]